MLTGFRLERLHEAESAAPAPTPATAIDDDEPREDDRHDHAACGGGGADARSACAGARSAAPAAALVLVPPAGHAGFYSATPVIPASRSRSATSSRRSLCTALDPLARLDDPPHGDDRDLLAELA